MQNEIGRLGTQLVEFSLLHKRGSWCTWGGKWGNSVPQTWGYKAHCIREAKKAKTENKQKKANFIVLPIPNMKTNSSCLGTEETPLKKPLSLLRLPGAFKIWISYV